LNKRGLLKRRNGWVFHRRIVILAIAIITIVGPVGIFYAWDYRAQTLIDDTVSIRESYVQQFSIDLSFGSRNVEIAVETHTIPVYVTFWWQSGPNAVVYLRSQPVAVNSTWTSSVTLHNSGGQYSVLAEKSEAYGEGLTTVHVRITV